MIYDSEAKFPVRAEVFLKNKILCYKKIFHIGIGYRADEKGELNGAEYFMDFCDKSCVGEGGEVLMEIPWKLAEDIKYMLDL